MFPKALGTKVYTHHTHTHHCIQIKWIYIKYQIKCYTKFITRFTKYELNHEYTVDNGYLTNLEPWKHARWNKPDTKGQILYDSTYMKYLENELYFNKKGNI